MTPPGSPSALLERAAEVIEQRATHFEDYRKTWRSWPSQYGGPVEVWTYDVTEGNASQAAKQWVEMMSPAVAQSLVEWLRDAARRMELHPHLSPEGSTMQRTALAFARQVLGEPLNHDWFFPYDSHPGARECSRCGAHDDSQPCP